MDVVNKVIEFFFSKGLSQKYTQDEILNYNYFESGLIDSMGTIEMVEQFEQLFNIKFSMDDMLSDDFLVVGDLINLINKLLQDSKHN